MELTSFHMLSFSMHKMCDLLCEVLRHNLDLFFFFFWCQWHQKNKKKDPAFVFYHVIDVWMCSMLCFHLTPSSTCEAWRHISTQTHCALGHKKYFQDVTRDGCKKHFQDVTHNNAILIKNVFKTSRVTCSMCNDLWHYSEYWRVWTEAWITNGFCTAKSLFYRCF